VCWDDPGVTVCAVRMVEAVELIACHVFNTADRDHQRVSMDIADHHIVGPARRWAVTLDAGGLVFVDSDQLVAE